MTGKPGFSRPIAAWNQAMGTLDTPDAIAVGLMC